MKHHKPNRILKKLKTRPTLFIGILFVLIAIIIAFLGQFSRYEQPSAKTFFNDFYTNITTDLIAIAVTVLIIDTLNQRRAVLGAILPDGSRYDGRFNLPHDIRLAEKRGYDLNNPEEAARFYGITPARYLENHRTDPNSEIAITTGIYKKEDWLERYLNPDTNLHTPLAKEPSATTAD